MTNEIVPGKFEVSRMPEMNGYNVTFDEKTIFFPNAELMQAGCKNCVWKLHAQCPHGLTGETVKKEGICNEMLHFLTNLAEKNDNLSSVWEKFHIYKARLQEAADYKDFLDLQKEIEELENNIKTADDIDKLKELRMNKTSAKIWWVKLNQHVVQSLQKVNDRDVKATGVGKVPGIHSTGTINFINSSDKKQIEEKK